MSNDRLPYKPRLNILLITSWYPHEENPIQGIFVKEHAKAIALYNDVKIIFAYRTTRLTRRLYELSEKTEEGIKIFLIKFRKFPIPKTTIFIYLWGIFRCFKKLRNQGYTPDIINAHVFYAGFPAIILGKIYNIPVVITEHYSRIALHKLRFFERLQLKFTMNSAKKILPVSEFLKRHIKSYGIKNNFRLVSNPVNIGIFYPRTSSDRNKNKIKKILFVGSLIPIKGIPYLLEALSIIKQKREDFHLDIVGDGCNRREYEELAKTLGLQEMVKFHGLKKKYTIAEFMRNCDFLVLSSEIETLPCALIEAMASGLPVVATNVGANPELVNEKIGLLSLPRDKKALAEVIDRMLDKCRDFSQENIAKYAAERFTYEIVGQIYDKVYHEVTK